jgi:hypothetical protein
MFEDQKVELLPERTTMNSWRTWTTTNTANALAMNVADINSGRWASQANMAEALSVAGGTVHF